jgi:hypothetical protein
MIPTPEMQTKVAEWRAKAAAGTLSLEETREAIKLLRESRTAALTASAAGAKKSKGPPRSADDLLGELGGL